MAKHNDKGRVLEIVVALLEKTFSDNSNTKLELNKKLLDQHGVKREIDVYVEAIVNRKTLKYAFECKNQRNGITLKDIVDFDSKIEGLGIKGFYVTSSRYLTGATKKAKAISIDLYTIKERKADSTDMKGVFMYQRQFAITETQFFGSSSNVTPDDIGNILETCEGCKKSLFEFLKDTALPIISSNLEMGIKQLSYNFDDLQNIKNTLGKSNAEEVHLFLEMENFSINHKGRSAIPINHVRIKVKFWNEHYKPKQLQTSHFLYCSEKDINGDVAFSINELLVDDQNVFVCLVKENDSRKMTVCTKETINQARTFDTHLFGSIDEFGLRDLFSETE